LQTIGGSANSFSPLEKVRSFISSGRAVWIDRGGRKKKKNAQVERRGQRAQLKNLGCRSAEVTLGPTRGTKQPRRGGNVDGTKKDKRLEAVCAGGGKQKEKGDCSTKGEGGDCFVEEDQLGGTALVKEKSKAEYMPVLRAEEENEYLELGARRGCRQGGKKTGAHQRQTLRSAHLGRAYRDCCGRTNLTWRWRGGGG